MRKDNKEKGVALVEFALVLPFLLLLSFISIEFGRALWHYNALTKSVRDAVRYVSMQTPGTHVTEARNLVVFGNTAGTGSVLVPGLTIAHVPPPSETLQWWTLAGTNPTMRIVTVRVRGFTFTPMSSTIFGVPFGAIPFSDISATMRSPMS